MLLRTTHLCSLLLCAAVAALPSISAASNFNAIRTSNFNAIRIGGNNIQPQWLNGKKDYGWKLPGIWKETLCYAPNRTIVLGSADPRPHMAVAVTFGPRPPSIGSADWTAAKRRQDTGPAAAAFCISADSESIVRKYGQLQSQLPDRTPDRTVTVRTCSLDFFAADNHCPRLPREHYEFCEGVRELMRRGFAFIHNTIHGLGRSEEYAPRNWAKLLVEWIRKEDSAEAQRLEQVRLNPVVYLSLYGGICGYHGSAIAPAVGITPY